MRRLVGSPAFARSVAQQAPKGYIFSPPGHGYLPGYIIPGPYTDSATTVCLLPGDRGRWFTDMIDRANGIWTCEGDWGGKI